MTLYTECLIRKSAQNLRWSHCFQLPMPLIRLSATDANLKTVHHSQPCPRVSVADLWACANGCRQILSVHILRCGINYLPCPREQPLAIGYFVVMKHSNKAVRLLVYNHAPRKASHSFDTWVFHFNSFFIILTPRLPNFRSTTAL